MSIFSSFFRVSFKAHLLKDFANFEMLFLRRGLAWDVHDGWSEEVLRGHEKNGQQKTGQSNTKTKGKCQLK